MKNSKSTVVKKSTSQFNKVWDNFVLKESKFEHIKPFTSKNNIPIVLATDNNYSKYMSVAIESIIKNSTTDNNYDFIILDGGIKETVWTKIKGQFKGLNNFSLRRIDMSKYINLIEKDLFFESRHIKTSAYYRLFIPNILKYYKKCLYLDIDIIVKKDISELYNIELKNNVIGACEAKELVFLRKTNVKLDKYLREKLKLSTKDKYFNSGVLSINIEKMKDYSFSFFSLLKELKNPRYHDQDILNSVFNGKVKFLDSRWNVEWHIVNMNYISKLTYLCLETRKHNKKIIEEGSFFVIHYIGGVKPWHKHNVLGVKYFWEYAKTSPFYFSLLYNPYKTKILRIGANFLTRVVRILTCLIPIKNLRKKARKILLDSI
ncbi:MAG: glycosyltransferase family 8 protein [Alphaproteobacteria bacterium]|nr:glycosyltransferase family 8 protein [Alphaproteobacteria bacterium]